MLPKLKRRSAGLYDLGEWTLVRCERSDSEGPVSPGYEWYAHHPDHADHYARTLRELAAVVRRLRA